MPCAKEDVAFEALLEKRVHQEYDKDQALLLTPRRTMRHVWMAPLATGKATSLSADQDTQSNALKAIPQRRALLLWATQRSKMAVLKTGCLIVKLDIPAFALYLVAKPRLG